MYVYSGTVYNSKDLEPTQMPIDDRLNKVSVAHIHHGILCSHKNDELVYFVGTWMNLETIILSKLTQEQKIKHRMFSLIGGCRTMRTHGHHTGVCWQGPREGQRGRGWGGWGGITWGEVTDVGVRGMEAANLCTYATILHDLHMYPRT